MEKELIAGIIFVGMYAIIVSEKVHRTVIAMLGAIFMLLFGILTQEQALHHVDFNTPRQSASSCLHGEKA